MHIVILAQSQGFLLSSIQEHLEAKDYQVTIVEADIDAFSKMTKPMNGLLIYADENFVEDASLLVYVKDRAIEEDTPVFIVGGEFDVAEMAKFIPDKLMQKTFSRPIDVKKVAADMDEGIREFHLRRRKKILVVDDSGAMLRNVKGWLEGQYQVIPANSGMMAIKYLTQNRPDLILLDYEMPVCDGKQVLEMIRSETDFKDVPVIFLTSKSDRNSVIDVMPLSPDGYLLKTMPPEEIIKAVDDFFKKQKEKR